MNYCDTVEALGKLTVQDATHYHPEFGWWFLVWEGYVWVMYTPESGWRGTHYRVDSFLEMKEFQKLKEINPSDYHITDDDQHEDIRSIKHPKETQK